MTTQDSRDDDVLLWLEQWYGSQTNGEWEHECGIRISTLDNPGWRVKIDLKDTELDGARLDRVVVERTDDDWIQCWTDGTTFNGAGGPSNLVELLNRFRSFAEQKKAS